MFGGGWEICKGEVAKKILLGGVGNNTKRMVKIWGR